MTQVRELTFEEEAYFWECKEGNLDWIQQIKTPDAQLKLDFH